MQAIVGWANRENLALEQVRGVFWCIRSCFEDGPRGERIGWLIFIRHLGGALGSPHTAVSMKCLAAKPGDIELVGKIAARLASH